MGKQAAIPSHNNAMDLHHKETLQRQLRARISFSLETLNRMMKLDRSSKQLAGYM